MTQPIDLLWGECDDHDAMSAAIRRALSVLSYEFRFDDGPRRISAAALLD